MKRTKIFLSLFILLVFISSVTISFHAFASELTTGSLGNDVTYSYDSDSSTLTISGTGNMKDYMSFFLSMSPLYNHSEIENVVIEDGVTNIGNYVFNGCTGITNIIIPESVTKLGSGIFNRCTSIGEINIPSSVTTISTNAFNNCSSLSEINISSQNTKYCSENGILFNKDKTKLYRYPEGKDAISFTVPNHVASLESYAFYNCRQLNEITIADSVNSINDCVFYNCSGLDAIDIPDTVTSLGNSVFYGCSNITELIIPSGVKSIGSNAFTNCSKLTSITLQKQVTTINNAAFKGCEVLENVYFKGTVSEWEAVTVGSDNECLTNATIHAFSPTVTPPTCTQQGYTTFYCVSCDDSYVDDYTEPLGHDYVETVTEPTCTERGFSSFVCSRCGASYTTNIEALGHTPGEAVKENVVAPTHTSNGSYDEVIYCARCNAFLSRQTYIVDKLTTDVYIDYDDVIYSGDTVSFPVVMENNVGILGFGIKIDYSTEAFEPIRVIPNTDFSTAFQDNIKGNSKPGSFKVFWAGNSQSDYNGTIFYIEMRVKDNAVGEGTLKLSCLQEDTFDIQFNDVVLKCTDYNYNIVNEEMSNYLKIESRAENIVAGDDVELVLKLTQMNNLDTAQINIDYNSNLKYLNYADSAVACDVTDRNGKLTLSLSQISENLLNTDIVKLRFKSGEKADSGKYNFVLSSDEECVKLTSCSFDVEASSTSEISDITIPEGTLVETGETFTVPVNISNNKGIMGYRITVEYNADELEPVSVAPNIEFKGDSANSIGNTDGKFDVIWSSGSAVKEDSELFTITFNAVSGKTVSSNIRLSYRQSDTFNETFDDVVFNCENSSVTICSGHEYQIETSPSSCTEQGCSTYRCINCGNTYSDNYTDPIGHYYRYTGNRSDYLMTYVCVDCGSELSINADEVFSMWSADYVNLRPNRVDNRTITDNSSLLNIIPDSRVDDGIINGKDYAAIYKLTQSDNK